MQSGLGSQRYAGLGRQGFAELDMIGPGYAETERQE
jgi:hypothetical protein